MYSIIEPRLKTASQFSSGISTGDSNTNHHDDKFEDTFKDKPQNSLFSNGGVYYSFHNGIHSSVGFSNGSTRTSPAMSSASAAAAAARTIGSRSTTRVNDVLASLPQRTLAHPARRALVEREYGGGIHTVRSTSFDEKAEWSYDRRSPTLSEDRGFESASVGGMSRDRTVGEKDAETEGERAGSVSMDKISTMTLNEFKSLLNSNLTVPDAEAASAQAGSSGGRSPASNSDSGLQHPPNWDSLREKARSLRDSMETARRTHVGRRSLPQSPDSHHGPALPGGRTGNNSGNSSPVMSRPKTPTSSGIPRPKTPTSSLPATRPKTPTSSSIARPKTPSGTSSYNTGPPREEYRMSRPKTPSQVKRDAVARVAGAISNWVESRPEAAGRDNVNRPPSRPKTPTRSQSGRTSRCQDVEEFDEDDVDLELSQFEQCESLPAGARERPSTPSRIPKPCLSSNRPTTPKVSNIPVPSSTSTVYTGSVQQRSQSAVPFSSTTSARDRDIQLRQQQLQRLQQELDEAQKRAAEEYQQQQQQQQQQYYGQHSTHAARPNFLPTSTATLNSEQYNNNVAEQSNICNGREENTAKNKIAVSRKLPLPRGSSNNSTAGGDRSYREIHTVRRCTTPVHSSGETRHQPSRAVTPGPREKWSISGQFSRSVESGPTKGGTLPRPRRASLNSVAMAEREVESSWRYNREHGSGGGDQSYVDNMSNMAITNEITFSDDEEINELVRNVALSNSVSENSFKAETNRARPASAMDMHRSERQVARRGSRGGDGEEVLMIHRNATGGHAVQVVGATNSSNNTMKTKPAGIMRRPANTSTTTPNKVNKSNVTNSATVNTAARFRSQTPDPSMFRQKQMSTGTAISRKPIARPNTPTGSAGGGKSLNRTEAWVDSTLSDPKRKVISKARRSRGSGDEVSPSELEPRPLEEIKAILPTNVGGTDGTASNVVDTTSLEAPPEDPEMFKKMERLFEKYREMELRASVNDTPGGGGVVNGSGKATSSSDAQSSSGKPGNFSRSSSGKPALSIKTSSSGSHASSSGGGGSASGKLGQKVPTKRQNSATSSDVVDNARYKRTSSSPGSGTTSYPRHRMSRSAASSALNSPSVELREFTAPNEDCVSHLRSVSDGHQQSLMDIDPETAKNPTALISKIKEILKVRPRKDDNDKTAGSRTRIPAPSTLSRSSRSKSVSNLFSERRAGRPEGEGTNYDLRPSNAVDDMEHVNGTDEVALKKKNHGGSSGNISYSEFVFHADQEEEDSKAGRELSRGWSVQSDSSDGQSRCETPAPKLATPLTTGRSTLMKRNDRMGRGNSLEKENTLSTSQNSLSSRSAFSTTEEDADYV